MANMIGSLEYKLKDPLVVFDGFLVNDQIEIVTGIMRAIIDPRYEGAANELIGAIKLFTDVERFPPPKYLKIVLQDSPHCVLCCYRTAR